MATGGGTTVQPARSALRIKEESNKKGNETVNIRWMADLEEFGKMRRWRLFNQQVRDRINGVQCQAYGVIGRLGFRVKDAFSGTEAGRLWTIAWKRRALRFVVLAAALCRRGGRTTQCRTECAEAGANKTHPNGEAPG